VSGQPAAPPLVPFEKVAVAQPDRGKRVKQRDYLADGRIPVIDQGQSPIGGYTNDDEFAFIGELPVVLFGDHTRAVKLVDQRFAVGADGIKIFRPAEGVRAKYLYYWMKSAPLPDRGYGRHYQYLRQLSLPLPPPKRQDEIVAELEKQFSRLDEAVANLKRAKANLRRYRAAVLIQAINGALIETRDDGCGTVESGADLVRRILDDRAGVRAGKPGKGVPVEPGGLGDLPAVPGTWTWATLDQIGQEGRSVIYGIIKPGPDTPGGVPYVRVTEMKDGSVDMPSLRRAAREREAKFSRARLLAGDLLISKDGTIGRVAVVPRELEGGNITQHVMRAPIHRYMNREFVVWAIRSEFCQRWLTGETRGVALRGVNVEDFRRLPIPVPPRIEQDRIVAEVDRRLSIVREVEAEVDANLKRTQALRQAVLQKAFAFHVASETMAVA
jgi:type I restriction enzyme S subunit